LKEVTNYKTSKLVPA